LNTLSGRCCQEKDSQGAVTGEKLCRLLVTSTKRADKNFDVSFEQFSVANAYYFLLAMFTVVGSFAWDNVDLGAE